MASSHGVIADGEVFIILQTGSGGGSPVMRDYDEMSHEKVVAQQPALGELVHFGQQFLSGENQD